MRIAVSLLLMVSLSSLALSARAKQVPLKQLRQEIKTEQEEEKDSLKKMRDELNDLKSTIMEGSQAMGQLQSAVAQQAKTRVYRLAVKDGRVEIMPGVFASALTYNGLTPGPVLEATEGDTIQLTVSNESRQPTSFYIDGLILPHAVAGLPREGHGVIKPGAAETYQFKVEQSGLFTYHPQVNHLAQKTQGLFGMLVVDADAPKTFSKEQVMVIGQWTVAGAPAGSPGKVAPSPGKAGAAAVASASGPTTYFTVNGKSAPAIPPIAVVRGDRVRLYVANTTSQSVPLQLTGHRFEVISVSGSDAMEPHVFRDTYCVQPGDRVVLEFLADNPGVWSLASQLPHQVTNRGKFPGGIAIPVIYPNAE
ncbi:MAG: multicopper oxidase domain-containing protein [Candidatus Obscuribacterales bacterium]|nr:multicopper oxidase domain-containing protein [Candidatus Obscuribacterales bacterium]